jgi:hypothetical protein
MTHIVAVSCILAEGFTMSLKEEREQLKALRGYL